MSSCEKCWADSQLSGRLYYELLKVREGAGEVCTAEEQAGPDAGKCPICNRMTMHQHTGEAMCGCTQPPTLTSNSEPTK